MSTLTRRDIDSKEREPFFIVGAPRCGTTALTYYLRGHSEICMTVPKETHFFLSSAARQDPARARDLFMRRYLRHLGPQHKAFGEGSVSSIYAPEAIARIGKVFPRARFIAMVRDPVSMFRSYHGRLVFCRQETEADPNVAWRLQSDRAANRHVPRSCRDARLLQYGEIVRLGQWIERLFNTVGRDRCHVVFYDELQRNPRKVYRQVLSFLDLSDDDRVHFPRKNVRRGFRWGWLQDVCFSRLFIPTIPLDSSEELDLSPFRQMIYPLHRTIRKYNTIRRGAAIVNQETRDEIRAYCAQDSRLLKSLLGRSPSNVSKKRLRKLKNKRRKARIRN